MIVSEALSLNILMRIRELMGAGGTRVGASALRADADPGEGLGMRRRGKAIGLLVLSLAACIPAESMATDVRPAQQRIAVLDFHDSSAGAVKPHEVIYLSELVRGAARLTLPKDRFLLMTSENILAMLPPGISLPDCVGECAVDTGRKIVADYVVAGDVTSFGGQVRVTANLYEISSGNLLGQVIAAAPDVLGVEGDLKAKVLDLFTPLRGGSGDLAEGRIGGGATAWSAAGVAKIVIAFASDPPGAMVEVDGQPVDVTPCAKALAAGVYRVGIKKVHYLAHEQSLEVKAGVAPKVSVTLTPDFGWLTVESSPAGLAVTIDAVAAGNTPLTSREVSPGPHEVMVTGENYHDEGQRIVIERGQRETVRVAPVPRNGGIMVIATDSNGSAAEATIKVDDRVVGKAYEPITLLQGWRKVTVESTAGVWSGEVVVAEEQISEVRARLVAMPKEKPVKPRPWNAAPVQATLQRIAVLNFRDSCNGIVTPEEVAYLSEAVRGEGLRVLPAERFVMMTSVNIQELLPEGWTLTPCVGNCAVEAGRRIGADFVVTGEISAFSGELRLELVLYETAGGTELGHVYAGARDTHGVEKGLDAKVRKLMEPMR